MTKRFTLFLSLLLVFWAMPSLSAQESATAMLPENDPKVTYTATYDAEAGLLKISVDHEYGWKTYDFDNTELGGFSGDTTIEVGGGLKPLSTWDADPEADMLNVDENGDIVEDSLDDWGWKGHVEFTLEVERVPGEFATITIDGQTCKETCQPLGNYTMKLKLPKYVAPVAPVLTDFGGIDVSKLKESAFIKGGPDEAPKLVEYSAEIVDGKLVVKATHAKDWHTYAFDNKERGGFSPDTKITVIGGLNVDGTFTPSEEAHDILTDDDRTVLEAKGDWAWGGEVTFTAYVKRVADLPTLIKIDGQVCETGGTCIQFGEDSLSQIHLAIATPEASELAEKPVTPPLTKEEVEALLKKNRESITSEVSAELIKLLDQREKAKAEAEAQALEDQKMREAAEAAKKRNAEAEAKKAVTAKKPKKKRKEGEESEFSKSTDINDMSWIAFILFCMAGGGIALLMPCVFPMIPITISFFGKQAEATGKPTIGIAMIYGLGLMLSYTALGFLLSSVWSVGEFGNNFWVAVGIGLFFLVFAFSMLGMFELRLPSGLAQKFNMQGKSNGALGAFLLGLTFAVTSMACTVPVVGAVMAAATSGDFTRPIVGMLVYSGVVAAPFIVLGAAPGLLQKMPKAGGWMNNIKVVFGFIELAAAAEFFGWARLIPREIVIAIWIASCVCIVLYLLGLYRTKHDMAPEGLGPWRLIFATIFGTFIFWLIPGLDGTPLKSDFIESFLRADTSESSLVSSAPNKAGSEIASDTSGGTGFEYQGPGLTSLKNVRLKEALADAKKEGRPVFIDITGKN